MNLSRAFLYILLMISDAFAYAQSSGSYDLEELLNKNLESEIIESLAGLLESCEYSSVYNLLHSSYSERVEKRFFLESLSASKRRIEKLSILTSSIRDNFGYIVIRFTFVGDTKTIYSSVDAVIVAKESGEWKLLNFPFFPDEVPNVAMGQTIAIRAEPTGQP